MPSAKLKILLSAGFAVAALRAGVLVLADPIIGYANSYDFLRQSSCTGLWQEYSDRSRAEALPERPVNSLVSDGSDVRPELCVWSIDNLFSTAIVALVPPQARVDFRLLGTLKLATWLGFCAALMWTIDAIVPRAAVALATAICVGDIANIAYANTLYLEFSVVSSTVLCMGALAALYCASALPRALLGIFAAALVWLGLSKQQYSPLAVAFSLLGAGILLSRWRRQGRAYAAGLVALAVCSYAWLSSANPPAPGRLMYNIDYANKTDTYLQAVLPASRNPNQALQSLGLPMSCKSGIGSNWYTEGVYQSHPCPELRLVSRIRLLRLFAREPRTFFRPFYTAIARSRPLAPTGLGRHEDAARDGSFVRIIEATSLSTLFARVPLYAYRPLLATSTALGVALGAVLIGLMAFRRTESVRRVWACPAILFALGGLLQLYSLASSVFGDGYHELAKHAAGLLVGLSFQISALLCGALSWLFRGPCLKHGTSDIRTPKTR